MATASVASNGQTRNSEIRTTTVGEIAQLLNAQWVGDESTPITGVAGLESAAPGAISFIDSDKLIAEALESNAAAIIAPESLRSILEEARRLQFKSSQNDAARKRAQARIDHEKPIVFAGNPRLAFAKVLEWMQPAALPEKGVHRTAVIEDDAIIGKNVTIREGCYVGHHARVADGVVLYPHVTIGDGAQIGAGSIIYPSVVIYRQVHIGKRARIHSGTVLGSDGFGYVFDGERHQKVPQIGTVIIEDDVEIGANVCIDRATMGATRVGEGTKIDNLTQIAHNVQIGKNCVICGQVGLSGSVIIEDNVSMAGQVGLRDHVRIGKGAILGAKAGIMADIGAGEFVMGSPSLPQRDYLRVHAVSRKLPEMAKQLRRLEKQVEELTAQLNERAS